MSIRTDFMSAVEGLIDWSDFRSLTAQRIKNWRLVFAVWRDQRRLRQTIRQLRKDWQADFERR